MRKLVTCAFFAVMGVGIFLLTRAADPPTPPSSGMILADAEETSFLSPLPPDRFTGRAREAYTAATEIPDVLAGLPCYCGCQTSLRHPHLLACFLDDHAAG